MILIWSGYKGLISGMFGKITKIEMEEWSKGQYVPDHSYKRDRCIVQYFLLTIKRDILCTQSHPKIFFGHVIYQLIFNTMTTLYSQKQMSCVEVQKIRLIVWFVSKHRYTFHHLQMTTVGYHSVYVMKWAFIFSLALHHRPSNYTNLCWQKT